MTTTILDYVNVTCNLLQLVALLCIMGGLAVMRVEFIGALKIMTKDKADK